VVAVSRQQIITILGVPSRRLHIIFKHPVAFIYTSYTKYTVFNAT
jgi:hypothetical protein